MSCFVVLVVALVCQFWLWVYFGLWVSYGFVTFCFYCDPVWLSCYVWCGAISFALFASIAMTMADFGAGTL